MKHDANQHGHCLLGREGGNSMKRKFPSLDEMDKEEFDSCMAKGLADAKAGRGKDLDEAIAELLAEIPKEKESD